MCHKQILFGTKTLWFLNLIQPKSLNATLLITLIKGWNILAMFQIQIRLNPHETFQFSSKNFPEISIYEKNHYLHLYVYIFILVLLQDKIEFQVTQITHTDKIKLLGISKLCM